MSSSVQTSDGWGKNEVQLRPQRGKVVRVRGSVVDVQFDQGMPNIKNALSTGDQNEIVIEVASHLDEVTVRGIALSPTEGLARGSEVTDLGRQLQVPVGRQLLGRAFNVFGKNRAANQFT